MLLAKCLDSGLAEGDGAPSCAFPWARGEARIRVPLHAIAQYSSNLDSSLAYATQSLTLSRTGARPARFFLALTSTSLECKCPGYELSAL